MQGEQEQRAPSLHVGKCDVGKDAARSQSALRLLRLAVLLRPALAMLATERSMCSRPPSAMSTPSVCVCRVVASSLCSVTRVRVCE